MRTRTGFELCTSGSMMLLLAMPALAQESLDSNVLEEIVVSARKREESLQSVPLSVQAMSGDELSRRGVVSLNELASALPGINISSPNPGKASVSIRGVTSGTATPTTGFYLDDVAFSGRQQFNGQSEPELLDIQRVEALRGPQGTLYGAGSMGGAIKFVSNRPDASQSTVDLTAGTGSVEGGEQSYNGAIVANLPLVDDVLALRLAGSYAYEGGFIDRVPRGTGLSVNLPGGEFQSFNESSRKDVNHHRRTAGRVALGFEPDDSWSVLLDLRYQRFEAPAFESYWVNLPRFQQSTAVAEPNEDSMTLPMLTVTKRFGAVDLTSITSYLEREREEILDYTFYIGSLIPDWASSPSYSIIPTRTQTTQQELRLSSSDPNARLQFVVGAYWQREDLSYDHTTTTVGSGATSPRVPEDVVYFRNFDTGMKQVAIFGDVTWSLTDRIDLVVGGRGFRIENDINQHEDGLFNGGESQLIGDTKDSGFTPKLQLTGKLDDDHLVYTLASKGFRQGDVNAPVPVSLCDADLNELGYATTPRAIKSDSLWNYEIGTKNTFADRSVVLNVSAYFLDWQDIQQSVVLPTCGFGFSANVGAAEVRGAELEFRWSPLAGLTFAASGAYSDAKITEEAAGVQAEAGDRVQLSPKWVANGSVEYAFDAPNGWPLFARADYQWHDSQTQNFVDTITVDADPFTGEDFGEARTIANPGSVQRSYRKLNLSLGLDQQDWSVRLFVDNVTNERPILGLSNVASGGLLTSADAWRPRTIGVSATKRLSL